MESNDIDLEGLDSRHLQYMGLEPTDTDGQSPAKEPQEQRGEQPTPVASRGADEPEQPRSKFLTVVSNILSAVFSPLLVPTYAFAMAMWISYLAFVPERVRFLTCLVVFVITTAVPLGTILFLMRRGIVSDAAISKPSERIIPYTVTVICYLAAALYIYVLAHSLLWLALFFVGAAVAGVIDALITFKWKISAHATSMGGLCALVFFIGIYHIALVAILPWMVVTVALSGMVGSARIFLGRHTPGQVYAGWLVGAVVSFMAMNTLLFL